MKKELKWLRHQIQISDQIYHKQSYIFEEVSKLLQINNLSNKNIVDELKKLLKDNDKERDRENDNENLGQGLGTEKVKQRPTQMELNKVLSHSKKN
eukprot:CAMPEP_0116921178 /NCGR_PEP_ID=MMETSP0467-20121206/21472_1 /TAXON_ID=283647 /ORGANISM="Mesodinium pulex, Strain SPMC105" /LENGTH=95 /DNA_ID=CAMNT_0004599189 /DNA_START=2174 /DNA_END=2461 /DNA_ORIENTATION=-